MHHCFDYRHECCSRCEKGTGDRNCGITSDLERAVNEFRGGGARLKPAAWLAELVFRLCVCVCVCAVCLQSALLQRYDVLSCLQPVYIARAQLQTDAGFLVYFLEKSRKVDDLVEVLLHVADSAVSFQLLFVCVIGFRGSDCTCRT